MSKFRDKMFVKVDPSGNRGYSNYFLKKIIWIFLFAKPHIKWLKPNEVHQSVIRFVTSLLLTLTVFF